MPLHNQKFYFNDPEDDNDLEPYQDADEILDIMYDRDDDFDNEQIWDDANNYDD